MCVCFIMVKCGPIDLQLFHIHVFFFFLFCDVSVYAYVCLQAGRKGRLNSKMSVVSCNNVIMAHDGSTHEHVDRLPGLCDPVARLSLVLLLLLLLFYIQTFHLGPKLICGFRI